MQQLMLLEQHKKKKYQDEMAMQEVEQKTNSSPYPYQAPQTNTHALQDFQMQLMLLQEQKNKPDLMAGKPEPKTHLSSRPLQGPLTGNQALQDYQKQLTILKEAGQRLKTMTEQRIKLSLSSEYYPVDEQALQDYQTQVTLAQQQFGALRDATGSNWEVHNHALQNYQKQVIIVGESVKSLQAALGYSEDADFSSSTQPSQAIKVENYANRDWHMQQTTVSLPEAGTLHTFQGWVEPLTSAGPTDYQIQLMLLEQQNKKRLMLARMKQDAAVMGTD